VTAPLPPGRSSTNWSGYVLSGGPFSAVTGTFTVPSIEAAEVDTRVAEWVGLDGASPSDTALIQAGVQEDYDATTNTVRAYAWWEILPALETTAPLAVQPGDRVTVTLTQAGSGQWTIALQDDTTGQTFATTQAYAGSGATAEWIVEAPTSGQTGRPTTLGDYQPAVTFSGLRVTGTQGSLLALTMTQGGAPISVPSPLTPDGFSVAYGGTAPNPP
jgi:Peptidase A4 family